MPTDIVCLKEEIREDSWGGTHRYYGRFLCSETAFLRFVQSIHLVKSDQALIFPTPSKADWWLAYSKIEIFSKENVYYNGFEGEGHLASPIGNGIIARYGDGEMYLYKKWQ